MRTELQSCFTARGRAPGGPGFRTRRVATAGFLLFAVQVEAGMNPGLVLTQIPVQDKGMEVKAGSQNLSWAGWFEGARIVLVSPGNRVRVLSKGFSAAADPEISFDGQRVVFAGKKDPRAPWAVWETTLAGGACRQVTKDAGDCRNPVYLSSLYTLDSPEPWFTVLYVGREETFDESGAVRLTSLHSVKLDGGEPRRLTFNPKGDLDPVQTGDGRVIYAGWRGSGGLEPGERRRSLFSLNIDGTDQELYGGEQGKRFQGMPCATEGGLVVFVEADHPTRDGSGQLGVMEQRRPHHSYRQVTQDQGFAFLYPSLLGGNKILVSRRPTASEGRWGVYELDLETGQIESVLDSPGYHAVQAKALRARPVPDGRSTVVEPGVKTGILYVLNIYEADEHLASCLTPGSVSRVRLTEAVPAPAPRANLDAPSRICFGRRLLGEALVEKDGSLHLLVPADTPLELQALDANGLALASCRWIWVKPKENRGCIGCHEDHELVPENLYVLAVQRPASDLTPLPEQRRSVGFREQIRLCSKPGAPPLLATKGQPHRCPCAADRQARPRPMRAACMRPCWPKNRRAQPTMARAMPMWNRARPGTASWFGDCSAGTCLERGNLRRAPRPENGL